MCKHSSVFLRAIPRLIIVFSLFVTAIAWNARANIPGGGTGTGANVTITDNGTTVTMANGIVSITITKTDASIHTITYTYNNSGTTTVNQMLAGGGDTDDLYWLENTGSFLGGPFTESVVANTGTYAEISLSYASPSNGIMEVHYSMLKGSPGFYATPILTHRAQDAEIYITLRPNIYAGSQFNWMSVDANRNKLMEVPAGGTLVCPTSPVENYLWTSGYYQGHYEDKYKYTSDLYSLPAWGWSSVGSAGTNAGMWIVSASHEYYPGGPMDRSLMEHIGTTMLNVFTGNYYGLAADGNLLAAEIWTKTYGPYFYYCNNVSTSITDPVQASQALYADALAQGAAEATAWPYSWFTNANYTQASGRGTVTGTMIISDTGNPNASAAGLWVGVVQQPTNNTSVYDFQEWTKAYEFWVKTDAHGNFSIPNVLAGSNYTLYAFGAGAPGTYMSQAQTGGSPPLIIATPSTPFSVTVTGGATTALGTVTWTPTRYGPTVFEIGYPDRTARKFRHGDDYWVGDIGPSPTSPSSVWTKFMEYPFDFPNGPNYIVGTSRWTTDWNFIQPSVYSSAATWNPSSSNISFTLPTGTSLSGDASIYLGLAADYDGAIIFTVNGTNLGNVSGLTATPNAAVPTSGYYVGYATADASIREGVNGAFSDERLTFPASVLHTGTSPNIINIGIRQVGGSYFADHAMYDYIRLELAGYVPPAPASVIAYPGNNDALLSWPATPGATSYNILRSTTTGSGYSPVATGVVGPICGSGTNDATYLDTTASNGTTYYYVVQSVNPTGASGNSPQSAGATPASSFSTSAPAAPTGVTATGTTGSVTVNWTASTGANYYTVQRSTLYNNGGTLLSGAVTAAETYNTLGTITLTNTATGTSYTDSSPTNGSTYSYTVAATNAAGTSGTSTSVNATPLAAPPTAAPATVTATPGPLEVTLNWSAVSGATGYNVEVGTAPGGPYTYITTVSSLTYTNTGLANNTTYYYVIAANNSGGTTANSPVVSATTPLSPPASLTATPGNTQITLKWPAVTGATSYSVQRGSVTGGPYIAIGSSPGSTYTDGGLTNGTAYFYVVASTDANGTGSNSPEATATPLASLVVAPTSLTATATNGHIILLWNTAGGATSYVVMRSTSNGGPYTTINGAWTTTTYTDTNVIGGLTYYYVVAATNAAGTGANSNQASANPSGPASYLWTGASSTAWDYSSTNWVNGSGAATVYADGGNAIFPDSATTGVVALSASVNPASVNFVNSTLPYTVSSSGAGISGAIGVTMSGGGSVTLTGIESYTGATTINSGTYALGADSSTSATTVESPGLTGGTNASLGAVSSAVAVNSGGQLRFGGRGGATDYTYTIPNAITLNGGSIYAADGFHNLIGGLAINSNGGSLVTTYSTKNLEIDSALSGAGNLTIDNWEASGDTAGGAVLVETAANSYNGDITINAASTGFLGGILQIANNTALINAAIIDNNPAGGLTFSISSPQIGALSGPGNVALSSSGGGHGTFTLSAGANGGSTTYSGILSGNGGLTKTGAGTMIVTGSNTYTGTTTVSGGILEIMGAIAGSKSLSVSSGAVLYLDAGTLSIKGAITNSGLVKVAGAATVTLTGAFTNNGVLDLINGPQTLPSSFTNNGTVLTGSSAQMQQLGMSGSNFTLTIQGYAQHTYQLQSTPSLTAPVTWTNVGAAQVGTGAPLTFTDTGASSTQGFYEILVSP
jgi:rhamnogalacturonan endolyase